MAPGSRILGRVTALLIFLAPAAAAASMADHPLEAGRSLTLRFDAPAEIPYHCHPHPQMTGVLRVVAGEPAANLTIRAKDLLFHPREAKVGPGSNVTWVNEDSVYHTVTATKSHAHDGGHGIPALAAAAVLGALAAAALLVRR